MVTDAGGVDSPVAERRSPGELEVPVEQKRVEASNNGKTKKPTTGRLMRRVSSLAVSILARGLDVFDIFIKVIGPVFMLIALFLFCFETYTYFVHVLPAYGEDVPIILQASLTMLGVFLLFNLTFNYLKAIFTDPGLPPDWDGDSLVEEGKEDVKEGDGVPRRRAKRCYKCKRQKPERSHHCSVCKRCVLKMDHHCPWINNCVGFNNYRYFCLFLLYLALCCLFVIIAFFDAFLNTMVSPRKSKLNFGARQCVSLSWIIAACILFALCLLGGFHVWLVLTNQTTIEFHTNISNKDKARRRGEFYRNPYDLGRPRNFKQVFGPHDFFTFRWALSYLSQPPVGDGITYPSTSYNFSKT